MNFVQFNGIFNELTNHKNGIRGEERQPVLKYGVQWIIFLLRESSQSWCGSNPGDQRWALLQISPSSPNLPGFLAPNYQIHHFAKLNSNLMLLVSIGQGSLVLWDVP